MSSLDVLLRFGFLLLLGDFIYLILNNHVRIVLQMSSGSCLRLLGQVVQAEFRVPWIEFIGEQGSCSSGITSF